MKFVINFVIFVFAFSTLQAAKSAVEEMHSMFLPYIRRWVPPPCPINEIYKTCKSNCSDCIQRGRCITTKCEEGCDCAPRFFRVKPDGPCEPVAKCPIPKCGENEVFRECGPVCETCTLLQCHLVGCEHKCYCEEGYKRNKDGNCIRKEECPTRTHCADSEEWAETGPVDEFCIPGVDKEMSNRTQDIPRCYCKVGYQRNLLGHCVNETVCSNLVCIGNEIYHDCAPKCNSTCRNYGDPNCTEDGNCYPGCFCRPGYIMNDFRSCIEIANCPLGMQQVKVIFTVEEGNTTDTTLPPTYGSTDQTTLEVDATIATASAEKLDSNETIQTDESLATETSEPTLMSVATTSEPTLTSGAATTEPTLTSIATTSEPTSKSIATTSEPTLASIATTSEPTLTSATTIGAFVNGSTVYEKSYKKDKGAKSKEIKYENTAKEKDILKYEFTEN